MRRSKPLLIEIGQGLSLMVGQMTLSSWSTSDRPKKPRAGTVGFNQQTNSLEYWDGENWFEASMTG